MSIPQCATYRSSAVLVGLLPVMVEEGGADNVRLAVHQGLVDQVEHAVPLCHGVQQEDNLGTTYFSLESLTVSEKYLSLGGKQADDPGKVIKYRYRKS